MDSLIDNTIRKHSGSVAMSQAQRRQLIGNVENLLANVLFRGDRHTRVLLAGLAHGDTD